MRTASICLLWLVSTAAIGLAQSLIPHRSNPQPKEELAWSLPGNEVESPTFSSDGNFIVLVTRVHWPDGEESENLPDSYFTKLEQRKEREPRFADPVVKVIDLKGKTICQARYGTHPTIAPDNKAIAFSHQKNPITGMRQLAATQEGNEIQVFDCETKQAKTIAAPSTGYLDNPMFFPDAQSIVYTLNEPVNGAWGGPVGLERIGIDGTQVEPLLVKQANSNVPCRADNSESLTPFQKMMCSRETNLPRGTSFPTLLLKVAPVGNELLALEAKPIPSAGDVYLASRYELHLSTLFPIQSDVLAIGQGDMNGEIWKTSFQPVSGGEVMIFAKFWKRFSVKTREWLPQVGPRNANDRSIYSPSGRYYVAAEPVSDEPTRFVLYRTSDGQKLFTSATVEYVSEIAWNQDSTRFAVVTAPKGLSGSKFQEVLTVYSLQDAISK